MQKRVLSYFIGGAILAALTLAIIGTAFGQSIGGMIDNVARALARSAVQTNHTGSATINGSLTLSNALTVGGNITGDGTANRLPNQTVSDGASIMTRELADTRYSGRTYWLNNQTATWIAGNPATMVNLPFAPFTQAIRIATNNQSYCRWQFPGDLLGGRTNIVFRYWIATDASGSGQVTLSPSYYYGETNSRVGIVTFAENRTVNLAGGTNFPVAFTGAVIAASFYDLGLITVYSNVTGSAYYYISNASLEVLP